MPLTTLTAPTAWPDISPLDSLWNELAEQHLLPYANTCRWFAGKARPQERLTIAHKHSLSETTYFLILEIYYSDGPSESYLLPFAFATGAEVDEVPEKGRIAEASMDSQSGWFVDGIYLARFRQLLFELIAKNGQLPQTVGQIDFNRGKGLDAEDISLSSRVLPVDSSNSAIVFGDKYFLKLYRKLFPEMNPEVEMVAFISENSNFANIPAYAGSIIWQVPSHSKSNGRATPGRSAAASAMITLGMMQRMVANDKDSWAQTGDYLNDFLYAVPNRLFTIREDVFEKVELLGKRTGEMHCSLYQPTTTDEAFAPEPFTDEYREFLIKRFEDLLERRYNLLIDNYTKLDPLAQRLAWIFMEAKEMIDEFVADFRTRPLESLRIRIHGDYHLGQVLATGNDFVIIDFEGEPESTITERKIKHSPLKDVAGMIRSYHYAVSAKLFTADETAGIEPDHLQRVSERWFKLIRDTYLDAYLAEFGTPHPLFKNNTEVNFLLLIYLLEKAVYELGYEISYRPSWVKIPLKGIMDVVNEIEKIQLADPTRSDKVPRLQSGLLKNK